MSKPVRLQLSRKKGFRLQEHSLATNGLPAINVARPGLWGNPFFIGTHGDAFECVELYREREFDFISLAPHKHGREMEKLRGKNLACWCALGKPCHADVLLALANSEEAA